MRLLATLALLPACGRLGFEQIGASLEIDAGVADAGIDAPFVAVAPTRISDRVEMSQGPTIAADPDGFVMVWRQGSGNGAPIVGTRITRSGIIEAARPIIVAPDTNLPNAFALTWRGDRYNLLYSDALPGNYELWTVPLAIDGTRLGALQQVTNTTGPDQFNSIVWTGTDFVVAWSGAPTPAGQYDIHVRRLDADGLPQGPAVPVSPLGDNAMSGAPVIAYSGDGYLIAWSDPPDGNFDIYLRRFDASLAPISLGQNFSNLATGQATPHTLVWTGTNYVLVWSANLGAGLELYGTVLDPSGARVGADVVLSAGGGTPTASGLSATATWNGHDLILVWNDDRGLAEPDIFARRLSPDLATLGPITRITTTPEASERPRIVAIDGGVAAVWQETVSGSTYEIFFSTFEIPPR